MVTRRSERGFSLLESMMALGILLVGAVATASVFTTGVRLNGDARRMTRATAIAQDLVDSIALWPYDPSIGAPLANATSSNDADLGDAAFAFERAADPVGDNLADHGEADLTKLGARWTGLPSSNLAGGYERYWNVRYVDTNGNGVDDLAELAVIVRWPHAGGWRRVVLLSAKLNPGKR